MHAHDSLSLDPAAAPQSDAPGAPAEPGAPGGAVPDAPDAREADAAEPVDRQSALRALRSLEATEARLARNARRELDDARGKLIQELLPVLDNLDRTIRAAYDARSDRAMLDGVRMVRHQLEGVLRGYGVERI